MKKKTTKKTSVNTAAQRVGAMDVDVHNVADRVVRRLAAVPSEDKEREERLAEWRDKAAALTALTARERHVMPEERDLAHLLLMAASNDEPPAMGILMEVGEVLHLLAEVLEDPRHVDLLIRCTSKIEVAAELVRREHHGYQALASGDAQ